MPDHFPDSVLVQERSKKIHALVNDTQHVQRISINSVYDDVAQDGMAAKGGL